MQEKAPRNSNIPIIKEREGIVKTIWKIHEIFSKPYSAAISESGRISMSSAVSAARIFCTNASAWALSP